MVNNKGGDMKMISQHFGRFAGFRYIADILDLLNAPEHQIILVRYGPTDCNIKYYS